MNGTVYLLCFAPGIPRDARANASHYLGWSRDVDERIAQHVAGVGSPLVRAAAARKLPIRLARTWSNRDRHFERELKNRRNARLLCPYCQAR